MESQLNYFNNGFFDLRPKNFLGEQISEIKNSYFYNIFRNSELNSIEHKFRIITYNISDLYVEEENKKFMTFDSGYMKLINSINKFNFYDEKWGVYESLKIEEISIQKTIEVVKLLQKQSYTNIPDVFPTYRGTLQLEFRKDNNYLEIEFFSKYIKMLVYIDGMYSIFQIPYEKNYLERIMINLRSFNVCTTFK